MEVSDAKRLKALEDENNKLKKLLAEAMFNTAMLKDFASKKVRPGGMREATVHLCAAQSRKTPTSGILRLGLRSPL